MRHMKLLLAIGIVTGMDSASLAGPVCPIEDQAHCQSATTGQFMLQSDRMLGIRRADDFRPAGSNITRLCFFPCFVGVTAQGQGFECAGEGETPSDDYILKIYEDNVGIPGNLVSGIPANGLALTIDAKANSDPGSGSRCWRYSAPVAPATGITITPNECYWLEVTGLGEVQAQGTCQVHVLSSFDGNGTSLRDTNFAYELGVDTDRNDIAFCLGSGLIGATNPGSSFDGGCGNFPAACCTLDFPCTDGTLSECWGTPLNPLSFGIPILRQTCAGIGAPFGCPHIAFDFCQEAEVPIECQNQQPNPNLGTCSVSAGPVPIHEVCDLTVGTAPRHDCLAPNATCQPLPPIVDAYRCTFPSNNIGASTDGPQISCGGSGQLSWRLDVWHRYTAPCHGMLTLEGCDNTNYDSRVQVFGDHTNQCTPCPITDLSQAIVCSLGGCSIGSGASLRMEVSAGACYTIRVAGSGFADTPAQPNWGYSELNMGVVCNIDAGSLNTPAPAPPPHHPRKNRYISFVPNNPGIPISFRVVNLTASSESCWVDAPDANGNATCDPVPVVRVWDEPVIHVGDCEIAPVQDYDIYSSPDGVNVHLPGLRVETIRLPSMNNKFWGDVAGMNNGSEWTPPNLFTNVNDILAVLAYISNAAIKPTFQQANLQAVSSNDPCLNAFVNTADVLILVKAVAGDAYPFTTDPANCPGCP